MASQNHNSLLLLQRRYASVVLVSASFLGGVLILFGFAPLGKGLILGALFSILNFSIMSVVLPHRIGHNRGRTFWVSLTSIYGRFALMAIPLIVAVKYPQVAFTTVAIGLFMVPIAILGDHLWLRGRHWKEVDF